MLSSRIATRILTALVLLTALVWLYRDPFYASNLEPVPDATEYAVSAQHVALWGKFEIVINGDPHPPRYAPWFPLLLLVPIYLVAPGNLGAGVLSVLGCALLCIYLAYLLGRRLGGQTGGVLASLLLLSNISFLLYARDIMSDVPALACGLLAAWLFVRLRSEERAKDLLLVSIVCGVGFAFRGVCAALLLPFLYDWLRKRPRDFRRLGILLLGTAVFAMATAVFNQSTFGDWSRTGYQYWCAIPYDYLALTFSPRFLAQNVQSFLTWEGIFLLSAGGAGLLLLRKDWPSEATTLTCFVGLAALPISVLHLFYFYSAGRLRFHLLLLAGLAVVGGGGIGREFEKVLPARVRFQASTMLLVLAMASKPFLMKPEPAGRYAHVSAMAQDLPANAVLITDTDSVYLEPFFLRGTEREALPLTRRAEYASKVIVRKRIPTLDPPPVSSVDHRAVALLRAGAEEAIRHTAGDLEYVSEKLREGRPVYLDLTTTQSSSPEVLALGAQFLVVPLQNGVLARLTPRR